ncbi:gliding motility-associated C-terminal domain-containing protein [Marinifilum caeruleilacunae]|uniref:Gliding motility-associated C-terminal domain-containing protein n=1 Tax=Marinifilum caeruleilacunae TaxID=2499076 RepID=A0ABX1X1T8_9BACT|nr:gliding motility-associated C-terminal domain-containing protein [Marinifilum caeruleilacunae]NOU62045.1 gliding motility-associated C-terminal domain-containing protein [Marinifilum caeruleilacunae]
MKHFYPKLHTTLLLFCLFFTNHFTANAAQAPPDTSIDLSVDKSSICVGESISIFLASSEAGVEYQLKADGINTGSPIAGTGSQISFTLAPTATATYSVTATNTTTSETSDLTETLSVSVNPGPDLSLTVHASESQICKDEGVLISVDNTENGYNYLLNNGPDDFPPALAGNGGTVQFPQVFPQTNTTYQIFVSGGACHDQIMLNNTATINVAPSPKTDLTVYADNNQICPGESITITVENAETGIDYQIFDGSSYVAGPLTGTGGNMNFTLSPSSSELYTIRAFGPSCLNYFNLDQKILVTVGATPRTDLNLTADHSEICSGESVIISLEESENGVEYQLTDGTNQIGPAITGDGNKVSFAGINPTTNTTYHVQVNSTACSESKNLDNTITINVKDQPNLTLAVTPSSADICDGESISIFVDATESDVNYQLFDGTSTIGSAITGTGGSIEFIVSPTSNTVYEIQAVKNNCSSLNTLDQKSTISVNGLPDLDLVLSATPGEICEGESTIISIDNSENNVQYQLKDASGNIGSPINGNGGQISFPALNPTSTTNYLVDAIKTTCASVYEVSNQAIVTVNPQPAASISYNVNPSTICEGEIIAVTINGSENGIRYDVIGSIDGNLGGIEGNGIDISVFIKPSQSQSLSIQAQSLLCASPVSYPNTSNITVNAGPKLDLNVTANATQICESLNTPVVISIENSETGLSYWLKDHTGTTLGTATGNGGTLDFSSVSPDTTTTYIVETTMAGCNSRLDLQNTFELNVVNLPISTIGVSISEPEICVGENTIISIDSSEIGVNYQLFDGTYFEGDPIAGTGSALSFPEFSPFRSVNYRVVASNEACGTQQNLDQTIRVDVGLQPEIHLHPTIDKHTICEGEQVVVSLTPTDTRVQYQLWNGDTAIGTPLTGNNEEISFEPTTPANSTTYRIEAMGERCLAPVDIRYTVDVDVHHSPETDRLIVSNKDTLCAGDELVISIENSQADILYQLHDGSNFIEPNVVGNGSTIQFPEQYPTASSTYTVYAHETVCTDQLLMDHTKQIMVPDISSNSLENFATPDEFCEGESIDIELTSSISGISYVLQDGDDILSELTGTGGPLVFEDVVPGINSNIYVSIGNCNDKLVAATPAYTLQSNPKLQILTTDVQSGYDGNLVISVSEGVAPYTYIINPGETVTMDSPVLELSGLKTGTYQVLVVDGNACRSAEAGQLVDIELDEETQVIVNNALTPNGDGINDKWIIHYQSELGMPEVYVFNIYGQEVYHSKTYQNDWTGSYNGSTLPNGAYYYLIEFDSEDVKPIKGSLSILGN